MHTLNVHVMTIFPGMIEDFTRYGIIRRSREKGFVSIEAVNIRDAAHDRHKTVDDTPYGGGAGMVMKPDILAGALGMTRPFQEGRRPPVILMTPQGDRFDQATANRLSLLEEFILVCGRYRGVDERFRDKCVTDEISVGDYVLSGGEVAAMVVIDAVVRLVPGVLNDFESGMEDSFQNGLLDCPWYTRPEMFEGTGVPEVLLSGDHEAIKAWRTERSFERTHARRPDLLDGR